MSEVPLLDAKSSLKKIVSIIVNISGVNSDFIPKLRAQPEYVLEAIENYEKEKNALLRQIETNNEKINDYKNKISQAQRDILNFEEDNKLLTKKKQDLIEQIHNVQKEIDTTRASIKAKKEELEQLTNRIKSLETLLLDLSREIELFESKLKDLEKQLENTFMKKERYVQSYENRVAAMKILIKKKYINSSLYQFIRALQPGSALDLKNLLLAIDMRENKARSIIQKMLLENGPIIFDENAGTITLKEEVDF